MLTETITITAPDGLHARPAGELAKMVKGLAPTKVTLATETKQVNASSILSILSLGLKSGTAVTVAVEGGDESAALARVTEFLKNIAD